MKRQTNADVVADQDEKVHLIMEDEPVCVFSSSDMHRSATPASTPSAPLHFWDAVSLSTSKRVCSASCVFPFCSVSLLVSGFFFLIAWEDNCLTGECVAIIIRL